MLLLVHKRGGVLVAASTKLAMKKDPFIMPVLSLIFLVLSACGGKGPLPQADTTSPSISLTSPTNGAQNVAVNSSIAIKFSEAVDASTINEQTITLSTGTGNVPGSVMYSDATAVFKPASSLKPETIYTVTVDGGVKDAAGNAMVTPFGFIFITGTALAPTTISLSAPTVTYGANGIVTITVSSGGGIPVGNVSLMVDGGTAIVQELTGGSTAFTIPSPSAGPHTLNAEYAAQGTYEASATSGALLVNQAATTTTITAPQMIVGTDGSVTVRVSSAAGTPSGNVSLSVDNGAATTQGLIAGSTTFTIPGPSAGSHTLNAAYAAQGNFGASSASGTLGVGPGATAMSLTAPAVTYGADGSVTVTVSAGSLIPTGNVSLIVDNGTATTQGLINGSTTFTIHGLSADSHTLNAVYAAQGAFGTSSASGTLIVHQAATTTTITAPTVTFGAHGSVTVTVTSTAGTPTGNVSLSVDNGAATTQGLIAGSTTFAIPSPSVGSHTLNAAYAAQGNFGASSASGTLGVGVGATTMMLSAPTVTYGANGIVTATVSSASGTPTGGMSLSVDGRAATTQALLNGSTAFTITKPSVGTHTLNAAYAAQGDFGASSASGTLTVSQATAVNYTIIATAGPQGSINPSGTISVHSGEDKKFEIKPDPKHVIEDVRVDGVSQGQVASYTFTNVTANHTIDATFN